MRWAVLFGGGDVQSTYNGAVDYVLLCLLVIFANWIALNRIEWLADSALKGRLSWSSIPARVWGGFPVVSLTLPCSVLALTPGGFSIIWKVSRFKPVLLSLGFSPGPGLQGSKLHFHSFCTTHRFAMAHEASANVNVQQTAAALMRMHVPYLRNYVEGFLFDPIDLNMNTHRLCSLFGNDPELHEVLADIDLHLSALVKRYSVILPDGTTFFDTTGRNGADYNRDDWQDDEELDYGDVVVLGSDEVDPVLQCIEESISHLEELIDIFEENINYLHAQYLRDQFLQKASVDLAKRLNSGIRRLLNAEIVPLVFLLREEILEQERRLKMKKKPRV